MLDVGLIGLGAEWEQRYRPALLALRHRMRVRAVYAPVASQAEQLAGEWRCEPVHGMRVLMERPDVRAILILDPAWYGGVPAELASRVGKPAFLAGRLCDWHAAAPSLGSQAALRDATLMPDFGHRYMPATSRLKELLATSLGRPREIVIGVGTSPDAAAVPISAGEADAQHEPLARALDWCCHLVGTPPIEVSCDGVRQIVVTFRQPAAGGEAAIARIIASPEQPAAMFWDAEVRCARGTARPTGAAQIAWETAHEARVETLDGERAEAEVMLDHFSRRVVGGLIPVPTLDDVCLAFRLADAAERSRAAGAPVRVEAA
ncbi:MAG: hypothetical protein ACT4QC_16935 [Planctomycetaceae bacterium]